MTKMEERQVVKLCDDLADVIRFAGAALAELDARHHEFSCDLNSCERCNLRRNLRASLLRLKEKINAG